MSATWQIIEGDCRDALRSLPAGSVHTCVTSPPYFGLRDYGTEGQIGLEPTPDEFVAALVAVFREVRRVLRDDGTVWLNLGDSYAGGGTIGRNDADRLAAGLANGHGGGITAPRMGTQPTRGIATGCKPKDLIGIPWLVAFALRADGWVLRQEVIWAKPNPMPESVTDRCTKSHEQIFMFSKARWTGAEEPLPMRDVDAAWLAALVDGEGSICFQDRTSERAGQTTYSVRLSIVNTNRALLERVEQICGLAGVGSPSPRYRNNGENTGRPIYAWQVTNAKAARVIAAIRPYLIAKAMQADLALYVQALNRKHTGRGGYTVSRADQEAKAKAAVACSALNRGRDVDLGWFRPVKPGRWVPLPYAYDADAIREDNQLSDTGWAKTAERERVHGNGETAQIDAPLVTHRMGSITAGRNKRSVWTVSTQPYAGAHFATFPPKLIEPCILAGAPERACGECGAPWVRVVERDAATDAAYRDLPLCPSDEVRPEFSPSTSGGKSRETSGLGRPGWRKVGRPSSQTLGFEPSCPHGDGSASGVVLDPFAGAGTTGMVALRHNRSFIGIELNPVYATMARQRIVDDAPLMNQVSEVAA